MHQLPVDDDAPRDAGHVRLPGEPGEEEIDLGKGRAQLRDALRVGEARRLETRGRGGLRSGGARGHEDENQRSDCLAHRPMLPDARGARTEVRAYGPQRDSLRT
jgi:hypothetical protein